MKTLKQFFENTDLKYLSIENKIEDHYLKVWRDVYLPSQEKKSVENNITEQEKNYAFNGLSKRGKFLCDMHDFFDFRNIAEVGTAEGFQFFTFCEHLSRKEKDHKVYTCDIRDVRNKKYVGKFKEKEDFTLGDSRKMSSKILSDNEKIDMFWIDGGHSSTDVLYDVVTLSKNQSDNCLWVFDDFNERFGIYQEIQWLSTLNESVNISLGPTASGKPNNMLIVRGIF